METQNLNYILFKKDKILYVYLGVIFVGNKYFCVSCCSLIQIACILLGLLTVSVSASDYCQEHAPAGVVNGCSVPLLHFQYEPQFTPSCNKHDICYHCVSTFKLRCCISRKRNQLCYHVSGVR